MKKEQKSGTPVQPSLEEMFSRFLAGRAEAEAVGIFATEAGDVVPFEAAPVQPVDARLAWDEAQTAFALYQPKSAVRGLKAPGDWSNMVAGHEPVAAVALAAGNFPQLVRDLHKLTQPGDLAELRRTPSHTLPAPALVGWADELLKAKNFPQALLAIGSLRLARLFDEAEARLKKHAAEVPEQWQAAWENERAALAWHRGKAEEAAALWNAMAESVPVLFNRGMAALFLGKSNEARAALTKAVAQLPDDNAWHHLGRLYLAFAEMRG
jgi:tetratricopeptide (TPR) repeat protein